MPLEKGTYWKLVCDVHGADGFAGDEICWRVCESEKEAREAVEDCEGRIDPDGTVLCYICVEDRGVAEANAEDEADA